MLSADSVTKTYGRTLAVDRASLVLRPGTRIGLVGPSGSGKSTLARVLALLEPPDTGALTIDGQRVSTWGVRAPRVLRHRVQLIFQSPRLSVDPRLRIRDAILEPLRASGIAPRDLAAAAERVGLTPDLLDRHPHEVSEGQLQRACLARALIVRPRYLICDELSSMLDVSTQAALLETIAAVPDLGVLLITHDRVLAEAWCDDILSIATASPVTTLDGG
ncbi:dipeptide/oligopeptide/nickel ABC transporter ATP-binding protein [Solirubrobacter taibaiensis]|nr:dipeptide/oligopeptide/nickel ABC transporter ATP-binding protein [Solirubrobacter taibaiensis]